MPEGIISRPSAIYLMRLLTLMFLRFSLRLAWAFDRSPKSRLGRAATRALALVDFYSFSTYSWHWPIGMMMERTDSAIGYWCYLAFAIAFGTAIAVIVEIPVLALRERWFPAATRAAGTGELSTRQAT